MDYQGRLSSRANDCSDINETNVHLEQDLVELCHAGANFLIGGTFETMWFL